MESHIMKPWKNPYESRNGQHPLTIVRDLNTSMKVELIQDPIITPALREFVECGAMARAPRYTEKGEEMGFIIQEQALWQAMETLHFTFKCTGITRHLTHQLVRQRIGITFSQQCSDSVDWRHQNILIPRAINPNQIVPIVLKCKMLYADMIDSQLIPCQVARHILPHCLETFLYIHVSLATLVPMLKKRICTMTQPWETHLWAALTTGVVINHFPQLMKMFQPDCTKGTCFYHRAKENPASAYLYQPDELHGNQAFQWNPGSYIYDGTNEEINNSGSPHNTKYYHGLDEINLETYKEIAANYDLKI